MQYPLSRDEQAAMNRYLSSIRRQLQDVSDLFTARYGQNSNVAELAVKALVSSTLLEHEMMLLENTNPALPLEDGAVTRQEAWSLATKA